MPTLGVLSWGLARAGGWGGRSGEVHGPQGVVVDLDGLGQRLGVPTVTLTRDMAALATIHTHTHTHTQTDTHT